MTQIQPFSFKALRPSVEDEVARQAGSRLILYREEGDLVERHLSSESGFCRACVSCGYLSPAQIRRAALRYRLGMSRDGGVIFWQIDQLGQVYDGKVMYYQTDCHRDHHRLPTWVSAELKRFYLGHDFPAGCLPAFSHCLFGLHLLGHTTATVCVVEAEKTAVIMSEQFPQHLWLAAGGLNELSVTKLFPLRHHQVVLFPDTDETLTAYTLWYRVAQEAMRRNGGHIDVSPLLEQRATASQKRRKIDLVDYLFDMSHTDLTDPTD